MINCKLISLKVVGSYDVELSVKSLLETVKTYNGKKELINTNVYNNIEEIGGYYSAIKKDEWGIAVCKREINDRKESLDNILENPSSSLVTRLQILIYKKDEEAVTDLVNKAFMAVGKDQYLNLFSEFAYLDPWLAAHLLMDTYSTESILSALDKPSLFTAFFEGVEKIPKKDSYFMGSEIAREALRRECSNDLVESILASSIIHCKNGAQLRSIVWDMIRYFQKDIDLFALLKEKVYPSLTLEQMNKLVWIHFQYEYYGNMIIPCSAYEYLGEEKYKDMIELCKEPIEQLSMLSYIAYADIPDNDKNRVFSKKLFTFLYTEVPKIDIKNLTPRKVHHEAFNELFYYKPRGRFRN